MEDWVAQRVRKVRGYRYQQKKVTTETFVLDSGLKEDFGKLCKENGWSKSELYRIFVEKMVSKQNDKWLRFPAT